MTAQQFALALITGLLMFALLVGYVLLRDDGIRSGDQVVRIDDRHAVAPSVEVLHAGTAARGAA